MNKAQSNPPTHHPPQHTPVKAKPQPLNKFNTTSSDDDKDQAIFVKAV